MNDRPRINYRAFRAGIRAVHALHQAIEDGPLERSLVELVRIRASQLNGCAYCIDVHTRDARQSGESERRIYGLSAWQEGPLFSSRERAALALTEAVTLLGSGVRDELLDRAEQQFTDDELAALLYTIIEVNAWNRLAVTARTPIENVDDDSADEPAAS